MDMGEPVPVSSESEGVSSALPRSFAVDQNFPNPFNPTTTIKFDMPMPADVRLDVYNLLGQRVTTLVRERLQAGFHHVSFDAQNLASGMYIYRIEAGDFAGSKTMILIK